MDFNVYLLATDPNNLRMLFSKDTHLKLLWRRSGLSGVGGVVAFMGMQRDKLYAFETINNSQKMPPLQWYADYIIPKWKSCQKVPLAKHCHA